LFVITKQKEESVLITADLLSDLKSILAEERIIEGESQGHPLGNAGQLTVYPETEEEISSILKYANDNRKKLTVVGGGTKRGFGGLTESADILLSLSNYKGIVEHTVGDMTLTVKAGTPFKELQEYLAQHKQRISLDPVWPLNSTIGGIIASNESGPKRLGYGSSRDVVIGLRLVYPDGSIIRAGGKVVKNVAGYDMNKLFIGSMGTLGILSDVTLKLRPLPKYESLVLLAFPIESLDEIRSFVIKLLDSVMEPISLELLNPGLSLRLTGQQNVYTLAIAFEDVESSVRYQEEYVKSIQPSNSTMAVLRQDEAKTFWDGFYSISPNGAGPAGGDQSEAALKIGVVNLDVLKVIKQSHILDESSKITVEAHGGLGHGLCQINLRGTDEDIEHAINQMRQFSESLGGYAIAKHLSFSLRQKFDVWGEKPSHFFLLEGIKTKIDPNRVLNNKRFVGGI
jgi:glycolate oxidase FAD binding subunit